MTYYLESHNWIKKVINSCKTHEQINSCHNIIKNWENHTLITNKKLDWFKISMMCSELYWLVEHKQKIISKL